MNRTAAALVAGVGLLISAAAPALAQSYWRAGGDDFEELRPPRGVAGVPPRGIFGILRRNGLAPVSPPERVGALFVVRAVTRSGDLTRVFVDPDLGEVVRVLPMARTGAVPYRPLPPPYEDDSDLGLPPRFGPRVLSDDPDLLPPPPPPRAGVPDPSARGPRAATASRSGSAGPEERRRDARPQVARQSPAGNNPSPKPAGGPERDASPAAAPPAAQPPETGESKPADSQQPAWRDPPAKDAAAAPAASAPNAKAGGAASPPSKQAAAPVSSARQGAPRVVLPGGPTPRGDAARQPETSGQQPAAKPSEGANGGAAPVNPLE